MPRLRTLSLLSLAFIAIGCGVVLDTNRAGSSSSPGRSSGDGSRIDHPAGATEVVLRFEEGGGFIPADFIATQAPTFTLYGDGTVVFRNATDTPPNHGDGVIRTAPFRVARLSEEQIQELLDRAINRGALGIARAHYDPGTIADAPTATFTLSAGSIRKTVSVVALGMETQPGIDSRTLAALADLGKLLRDFDATGSSGAVPYEPRSYRAQLRDAGGVGATPPQPWPWPTLALSDFQPPTDQPGGAFLRRVLSAAEVGALGFAGLQGGAQGLTLEGPDGKIYSLAVRPLLPDERD
jgi:hypothetical protein